MTYPQDPQGGYYQQPQPGGYPQQQPPPHQGYPQGGMTAPGGAPQYKGFFASLFDLTFKSFVTPKVIQIYYVIAMVAAGLGVLALILSGFSSGSALVGIIFLVLSPIFALIYLLLIRMTLEMVANLFRIGENIQAMRDRADGQ